MSRFVYLNGKVVPYEQAMVHVEDRGFQLSDGVYEYIAIHKTFLVDGEPHLDRLDRSLRELKIAWPISREAMKGAIHELIERNGIDSGSAYIQVTRGVHPRFHRFPDPAPTPTVVIITNAYPFPEPEADAFTPCKVIIVPDIRWGRRDIKSVSILANCLAQEQAYQAGAYEAVMVGDEGKVTEGALSNVWIVDDDGILRTRHLDQGILPGISRMVTLDLCRSLGLEVREEAFDVDAMRRAREVFLSTSGALIKPVGTLDDRTIGDGTVGAVTRKLLTAYRARVFAMTHDT